MPSYIYENVDVNGLRSIVTSTLTTLNNETPKIVEMHSTITLENWKGSASDAFKGKVNVILTRINDTKDRLTNVNSMLDLIENSQTLCKQLREKEREKAVRENETQGLDAITDRIALEGLFGLIGGLNREISGLNSQILSLENQINGM